MPAEDPPASQDPHARRETRATLAAGLFTNGVWDMLSIIVPLYAVGVGLSVSEIGFIVAARSVLPTALSIHGGILMDRWGTRRVLTRLSIASIALPLIYPLSGWFGVLILLQLILGLASSLGMAAAQTWSLQSSHGDTAALARFSIFSRIGTFLGPVMIGVIWDAFGAWAAFACVSFWAAGILGSCAYGIPPGVARAEGAPPPAAPASTAFSAFLPRWAEHRDALALAAIPAVAFVLAVSFLRNSPGAIQASFYVVYLGDTGFSATMIGSLVGLSEFFGVVGSLAAAPLERLIQTRRLLIACIVSSIAAIALTPLIAHLLVVLFIASAVRGVAQGVSQPLMYSILGRAVPAAMHGATVGLRNSVTRLASIVTPAVMGIVAEFGGIEASFYVIGGLFLAATLALGVIARSVLEERRRVRR
jgi:MFS family permease